MSFRFLSGCGSRPPAARARQRLGALYGATTSVRGGTGSAAFTSAEFGLRGGQSLARELGPKNIHVAHLIIDAGVETEWVRERIKQQNGEQAPAQLEPDQPFKTTVGRRNLLAAVSTSARCVDLQA